MGKGAVAARKMSLPSPRAFFAFLFTERLFTTISKPGEGYLFPSSLHTQFIQRLVPQYQTDSHTSVPFWCSSILSSLGETKNPSLCKKKKQNKTKNKTKKHRTVDISSNLCGITGVVCFPACVFSQLGSCFHSCWSGLSLWWLVCYTPGVGGTPIHYLNGYVPPKRGRDFEAPDLERGIHFRGVF